MNTTRVDFRGGYEQAVVSNRYDYTSRLWLTIARVWIEKPLRRRGLIWG